MHSDTSVENLMTIVESLGGQVDFILTKNENVFVKIDNTRRSVVINRFESNMGSLKDYRKTLIEYIKKVVQEMKLESVGGDEGILAPEISQVKLRKNNMFLVRVVEYILLFITVKKARGIWLIF